jgi:hypothetical protein
VTKGGYDMYNRGSENSGPYKELGIGSQTTGSGNAPELVNHRYHEGRRSEPKAPRVRAVNNPEDTSRAPKAPRGRTGSDYGVGSKSPFKSPRVRAGNYAIYESKRIKKLLAEPERGDY